MDVGIADLQRPFELAKEARIILAIIVRADELERWNDVERDHVGRVDGHDPVEVTGFERARPIGVLRLDRVDVLARISRRVTAITASAKQQDRRTE
jgi:hypothetical protein